MEDDKLFAILRLQKAKGIGSILARKLIVQVGDVTDVFNEAVDVQCRAIV